MSLYMEINPPFQQRKMDEQMAQIQKFKEDQELASASASTTTATPVSNV
jgi:hypothetical protein